MPEMPEDFQDMNYLERRTKRGRWRASNLKNLPENLAVTPHLEVRALALPDLEQRCRTARTRIVNPEGYWLVPGYGPVPWLLAEATLHTEWWAGTAIRLLRVSSPRTYTHMRISNTVTIYWAQWVVEPSGAEFNLRQDEAYLLNLDTVSDAWFAVYGLWPPPFKYPPTTHPEPPETALKKLISALGVRALKSQTEPEPDQNSNQPHF